MDEAVVEVVEIVGLSDWARIELMIGPFPGISSRAACVPNDECGGPFMVHANVQPLPSAGFPHWG